MVSKLIWSPPVGGGRVALEFLPATPSLSRVRLPFAESPEQPYPPPKRQEKQAFLCTLLSRLTRHDHKGAPKSFRCFRGPDLSAFCCVSRIGTQLEENSVNLEEGVMLEGKA